MFPKHLQYNQQMETKNHNQYSDNHQARRSGDLDITSLKQLARLLARQAAREVMSDTVVDTSINSPQSEIGDEKH